MRSSLTRPGTMAAAPENLQTADSGQPAARAATAAHDTQADAQAAPPAHREQGTAQAGTAAAANGAHSGNAGRQGTPWLVGLGLHAYYGASHVLRGVDITIGRGEAVGLVGRNGMGKTTLIRTLVGHVRSAQGSVRVDGRDCTRAQPHTVAQLGVAYVPEGRGIFPNLSVRENLLVAARAGIAGRRDWDYARVLDTFPRLRERLGHGGQQLSGGEQQMLAIGRALMTNPELLILDEATEGLAPLIVAEIWNIVARIRNTGISTLIVDRNYRAVLTHTDRCIIMEKGKVVHADDSASLARDPAMLETYLGV